MSITNTYYKRNEIRLQERSQNRYHQEDVKKQKNITKIIEKDFTSMCEVNIKSCLMKKRIEK